MEVLVIVLVLTVIALMVDIEKMWKTLNEINSSVHRLLPNDKYEEYCVKPLNMYTTFRVVPYFNGINEVWDVEYRNPADTKWKVCRCEETEDKARAEMNDIIDRLKKGEI